MIANSVYMVYGLSDPDSPAPFLLIGVTVDSNLDLAKQIALDWVTNNYDADCEELDSEYTIRYIEGMQVLAFVAVHDYYKHVYLMLNDELIHHEMEAMAALPSTFILDSESFLS